MRTPDQTENDLNAILERLDTFESSQVEMWEKLHKNRKLAATNRRQITVCFLTIAALASGVTLLTIADSAIEQNLLSAMTLLSWSGAVAVATGRLEALDNLLNRKID
jgi:hypothetical protein